MDIYWVNCNIFKNILLSETENDNVPVSCSNPKYKNIK